MTSVRASWRKSTLPKGRVFLWFEEEEKKKTFAKKEKIEKNGAARDERAGEGVIGPDAYNRVHMKPPSGTWLHLCRRVSVGKSVCESVVCSLVLCDHV